MAQGSGGEVPAAPPIDCGLFPATATGTPMYRGSRSDRFRHVHRHASEKAPRSTPTSAPGSGTAGPIGIPYGRRRDQPGVDVTFDYDDESDPGPYPIPADAPIEGGAGVGRATATCSWSTRDACTLYELYTAYPQATAPGRPAPARSSTSNSNALRPDTLDLGRRGRAADPARPGALRRGGGRARSTTRSASRSPDTDDAYVWPARHQAGDPDPTLPPMGQRLRLKADFDISGFSPTSQVILRA